MNQALNQEATPHLQTPPGLVVAQAEVVAIEGRKVRVHAQSQSGCSQCHANKTCGTGVLTQWLISPKAADLWLDNELGAQVGEQVLVAIKKSQLTTQALMGYGLPLMGFFLMGGLAHSLLPPMAAQDIAVAVSAFVGLLLGWRLPHLLWRGDPPKLYTILPKEAHA